MQDWVRQFRKGSLELCVLNLLSAGESYGYEIVRRLQEYELLAMTESTLYPILNRLRQEGHLSVRKVPSEGGPSRRYFALTGKGSQYLERLNGYWEQLTHAIAELRQTTSVGSLSHDD